MKLFGKKKYNVLVLGSDGMLGHDVMELLKADALKSDSRINIVTGLDIADGYDFSCPGALSRYLIDKIKYDYCVNCIAYTDTAKAETPDGRDMSYKLNALVPYYLAVGCKYNKIKLIHISTDYVFSEQTHKLTDAPNNTVFSVYDRPFPINIYGTHKLLGEQFIQKVFGSANIHDYCIIRTSWLYGMHKEKSFVHKFLRNCMKTLATEEAKTDEKSSTVNIEVTENEVSVPTSTWYLSNVIYNVIAHGIRIPVMHGVPRGSCARFSFAEYIIKSLVEQCVGADGESDSRLYKLFEKLKSIYVMPVKRDGGLWPRFSAMSNVNSCYMQDYDYQMTIDQFVGSNLKKLMEFCENEYIKAGGKL